MRLDKWLQVTGLVPRRTRAKQACEAGLVEINGKPAKASAEVRVGQQITLRLGMSVREYEVLQLAERPVPRERRQEYWRLIREERIPTEL